MSSHFPEVISSAGSADPLDIANVVEAAYDMLTDRQLADGLLIPRSEASQRVGESGVCDEASDAVTRAAQHLGLTAIREFHEEGIHYITSLSPTNQPPSEDDMIICLTWGQFSPEQYAANPGPYIGKREGIAGLIGLENYQEAYSPDSVTYRQVTHTPSSSPYGEHVWLKSTPEDLSTGHYPLGEVPADRFDPEEWEFPHLVRK